ncbi:MAG: 5-oxoprolinase subunit PxpB [Candidatus Bipolaricaulis sp.]|nr:5-oxoprolinase subunit PxpB [Candidatus Bipolaricaulis sp.]
MRRLDAGDFCFRPMGDQSLLIEFEESIGPEIHRKVRALSRAIEGAQIAGAREVIPAYRSMLVHYDPQETSIEDLCLRIRELESRPDDLDDSRSRRVRVPVCYGGDLGPDLPYVAQHNGLTEDDVVAIHSGATYRVYMVGFLPGFPYLGGMSDRIATPRLPEPRTRTPAGSVGVAGTQTGVYPIESPGGWRIIGRTPIELFVAHEVPPARLLMGDSVEFVPISRCEFEEIRAGVERGEPEWARMGGT